MKTRSILDLMPPEEAEIAVARGKKRMEGQRGAKVSPEIYMTAEFGYYYGWDAVLAVRNNEVTLDEMNVLLEGARKVWYSKLVETSGAQVASSKFSSASKSYPEAIKPYTEKAALE